MASTYPANAVTYQFTIDPRYGWKVIFGTHMVTFPAQTICDPAASSYGPDSWLDACPKLGTPITITATTWIDAQGRPQIDFANAIRFYPNGRNQLPAIYLRDAWAAANSWGRIDYCSVLHGLPLPPDPPLLRLQRLGVTRLPSYTNRRHSNAPGTHRLAGARDDPRGERLAPRELIHR
jgi:hypothetical protein